MVSCFDSQISFAFSYFSSASGSTPAAVGATGCFSFPLRYLLRPFELIIETSSCLYKIQFNPSSKSFWIRSDPQSREVAGLKSKCVLGLEAERDIADNGCSMNRIRQDQ